MLVNITSVGAVNPDYVAGVFVTRPPLSSAWVVEVVVATGSMNPHSVSLSFDTEQEAWDGAGLIVAGLNDAEKDYYGAEKPPGEPWETN